MHETNNLASTLKEHIKSAINWCLAIGFHLYRVATFRPCYEAIADTTFSRWSFFSVFLACAYTYHHLVRMENFDSTVVNTALSLVIIAAISLRRVKSSSLLCALLASSAVVDIVGSVLLSLDLANRSIVGQLGIVEAVLYVNCINVFSHAPKDVQSAGYRKYKIQA